MQAKRNFLVAAGALGLGLAIAGGAGAADGRDRDRAAVGAGAASIDVIERRGERLDRAIDRHRVETLSARYRELRTEARKFDAAPPRSPLGGRGTPSPERLERAIADLRERISEARREAQAARTAGVGAEDDSGSSVADATLEAIAACESGGDPGAVNAAGYYGKYQFDIGTWQSVGGSGNPAQASEAEQDRRAAALYARAGAAPWPVCGQ